MNPRWACIGAISGFLCVALGAFGAHALRDTLDAHGRDIWQTAVHYQMAHSLALILVALWPRCEAGRSLCPAAWAFVAGIVLFSGSLYALALSGVSWLGAITPLGGLSLLAGWAWLAATMWRRARTLER
jgi:uncharacterized membrane protein YgdD (TMEM256/DUF423 family)